MKASKKLLSILCIVFMILVTTVGCTKANQQVIIYSNADEEAIAIIVESLDAAGYEGKYLIQSMGTSELGGKLIAEGKNIEANLVTMSSYFIESSQQQHDMFVDLEISKKSLTSYPSYYSPILAITGSLFVNTEVIKSNNLPVPTSIKDLVDPMYKGYVSIPNILDSSTAWLMVQSILNSYGEEDGQKLMEKLVENCGAHIESSGSGPIKKVRVGEVAVGFGLRHQAVNDQKEGLPINVIDPAEGNFSLTESVAVIKNNDKKLQKLAVEMAEVIINTSRAKLIENYPVALYEGESVDSSNKPANPKMFSEPLTVELLRSHQDYFKKALENSQGE